MPWMSKLARRASRSSLEVTSLFRRLRLFGSFCSYRWCHLVSVTAKHIHGRHPRSGHLVGGCSEASRLVRNGAEVLEYEVLWLAGPWTGALWIVPQHSPFKFGLWLDGPAHSLCRARAQANTSLRPQWDVRRRLVPPLIPTHQRRGLLVARHRGVVARSRQSLGHRPTSRSVVFHADVAHPCVGHYSDEARPRWASPGCHHAALGDSVGRSLAARESN